MSGRHRPPRVRRPRRLRALLAGGLVLGVGFSVTLAAWTDTEKATGTFGASIFGVQSSTNGSTWADHPTTPAALVFTAGSYSPGVARHAALQLRTIPGSVAGTAGLSAAEVTPNDSPVGTTLQSALRLRVVQYSGTAACSADRFTTSPSFVVGNSSTYAALTAPGTASVSLAAAPNAANPGAVTTLCFEVSMPTGTDNSFQGKTVTATWTVNASSVG